MTKKRKEPPLIPLSRPLVGEGTYEAVEGVLRGGWWTMGERTRELEAAFRKYTGAEYATAVSSCSAALHLAVGAWKQNSGDLVAVTPMTFCSTVNAIIFAGMIPYFIDIDSETGNMDPDLLEEAVRANPLIRGVVVVHFAGHPCDMGNITRIAKNRGLFLVEDCAHAVETLWDGRHAGTFGDVGCFSFNPTKNVAAPEMGMLVTNEGHVDDFFRVARLHGLSSSAEERVRNPGQYDVVALGFKYNPTDVEAAVALDQLRMVGRNYERRKILWTRYCTELGIDDELLVRKLECLSMGRHRHGLHLFQIFIESDRRGAFVKRMREEFGVTCGIHYRPVHKFSYMRGRGEWSLPNAEAWGDAVVSLPLGPGLTLEEVDRVVAATKACLRRGKK